MHKDLETSNMYLAEDRILCLAIYAKTKKAYTHMYIPNAYAFVDAALSLKAMLAQRKRWINGTWFALNFVINQRFTVEKSAHSWLTK